MDEAQGSNQNFKNKYAYQSQKNWIHPKKFDYIKALKHTNPEGNRLENLTCRDQTKRDSIQTKDHQIGLALAATSRNPSNENKQRRSPFVANFSVKKMDLDVMPFYRTLFPQKTSFNFRKNLSPELMKTKRELTTNVGKTGILKKIDRQVLDDKMQKSTRRQFYPKKLEILKEVDKKELLNHNYIEDMLNKSCQDETYEKFYNTVNKTMKRHVKNIKNNEPFKIINGESEAKKNKTRISNSNFFNTPNKKFAQTQRSENVLMEELMHITAPSKKKKKLECENYEYLQDAKKIRIKDLGVEDQDSFYKTTFPLEKIQKLLNDFAGNFSKQNLKSHLSDAYFIIDQKYEELKKTNEMSEVFPLAVGILRGNLITSEERLLNCLSLIFQFIEENLEDANKQKNATLSNSTIDFTKYLPRIFEHFQNIYSMFPNIRIAVQHGVLKLYQNIFKKVNYLPKKLLKIVVEWFLVNYQMIYFEVSEKIDDFYIQCDTLPIINKSVPLMSGEYHLYKLLTFGFGEVFNLFTEKVMVWSIIRECYDSNPLIDMFKRTVANILKIDYYLDNAKDEDRFNTYDSTITQNFSGNNINQLQSIKSICTDFLLLDGYKIVFALVKNHEVHHEIQTLMSGQIQDEIPGANEKSEPSEGLQNDRDSYSFKKENEDMKRMEDQQVKIIDDLLRSIKLEDLIFKFIKSCNKYITTRSMSNKNLEIKLQQVLTHFSKMMQVSSWHLYIDNNILPDLVSELIKLLVDNCKIFTEQEYIKVAYYFVMALCNLIKSDTKKFEKIVKKYWNSFDILLNTFDRESKHKVYQEYRFKIYEMIIGVQKIYKLISKISKLL